MHSGKEPALSMAMNDFNSTTKLTDSKSKSTDKVYYDPFDNRDVEHPNTDMGTLAHLLKSSLGSGILAMPLAFKNGGLVFGMVGTLIVGYICTHCVHMLVGSSHTLCKRSQIPSLTYAGTAEEAFRSGPPRLQHMSTFARKFVNASLISTYYSALCVYVVFIATSIKQVADVYQHEADQLHIRVYMAIILLPLYGLALIRNLKYLVPFSALANLFIVVGFAITLYYMFLDIPPLSERDYIANAAQLPLFFSTVIFAMEGIGVVMPLENSMKNPRHFLGCPGVLNTAMAVVVVLYALIGFLGYLKYGDDTLGSVTLNLPKDEVLAQVVKLLIAVAILFSYGLQFFIPTDITWPMIAEHIDPKNNTLLETIFRLTTVTLTVAMAAALPTLGPIISLVGAICFSNLGLLCPAVIETVTCWEDDLGRGNWRFWKNIIIIIFALVALVAGTYSSILEIIDTY